MIYINEMLKSPADFTSGLVADGYMVNIRVDNEKQRCFVVAKKGGVNVNRSFPVEDFEQLTVGLYARGL